MSEGSCAADTGASVCRGVLLGADDRFGGGPFSRIGPSEMIGSALPRLLQYIVAFRPKFGGWGRTRLVETSTICLFAYISLVPFYYLRPLHFTSELPPFFLPRYLPFVLVVFLALVWIYDALKLRRKDVRMPLNLFAVFYVCIGLLSLIKSMYPVIGLFKWFYFTITGVLLCYFLVQYLTDYPAIWRLMQGLCIIYGITVFYTLLCHLWGRDFVWGDIQGRFNPYWDGAWRATAPFGNAVSTGAYLSLCFPFILWKFVYTKRFWRRLSWSALSIMALVTLAFNQSRGGWLAIGIALLIVLTACFKKAWVRLRRDQKVAVLVVVVATLPVIVDVLQSMGLARVFERQIVDVTYRAELASLSKLKHSERFRIAQYRTAFNILKMYPLLGVGFGNFTRVYDIYKDPSTPPAWEFPARTTENMYLMFAAETGWLGLSAAISLLGGIFFTVYRAYLCAGERERRDLLLAFLAGGGGFLFNMGTWDALNDPTVRMTFWILAGVALAAARVESHAEESV